MTSSWVYGTGLNEQLLRTLYLVIGRRANQILIGNTPCMIIQRLTYMLSRDGGRLVFYLGRQVHRVAFANLSRAPVASIACAFLSQNMAGTRQFYPTFEENYPWLKGL